MPSPPASTFAMVEKLAADKVGDVSVKAKAVWVVVLCKLHLSTRDGRVGHSAAFWLRNLSDGARICYLI